MLPGAARARARKPDFYCCCTEPPLYSGQSFVKIKRKDKPMYSYQDTEDGATGGAIKWDVAARPRWGDWCGATADFSV